MKEFKVGDKVIVVDDTDYERYLKKDCIGIVVDISETGIEIDCNNQKNTHIYGDGIWWIEKERVKLYQEKKPRFHDAQVGDEVYCRRFGNGFISSVSEESCQFPILGSFKNSSDLESYTLNGKIDSSYVEPTLFYRKGEEKYLTERPESEIDWSKVPMGTNVFTYIEKEDKNDPYWETEKDIEMFMGYFPSLERKFWTFNDINKEDASGYKYCKLAEPCKPEWIKK